MKTPVLELSRISAGTWEGLVAFAGDTPPEIEVMSEGTALPGVDVRRWDGGRDRWLVRAPIPAESVSDGLNVFLVRSHTDGTEIGAFTILAGAPPEADIRADVAQLRAELDMLKQAFRRHCRDSGG
jgi:hypothetical protein